MIFYDIICIFPRFRGIVPRYETALLKKRFGKRKQLDEMLGSTSYRSVLFRASADYLIQVI